MKKLYGNGLWESSRMMLFEHRDAIIDKQAQQLHKQRPLLDEQQVEAIAEQLSCAYKSRQPIRLRIYGLIQDEKRCGMITRIDPLNKCIRLADSNGSDWIPLSNILETSEV